MNTQPLPAAQLLKLADELLAASSECNGGTLWRVDEWSRLQLAEEAYRAARAASPVTLEEALMVKEYEEQERFNSLPPDDRYHKYEPAANAIQARHEHARRLAGEGGA